MVWAVVSDWLNVVHLVCGATAVRAGVAAKDRVVKQGVSPKRSELPFTGSSVGTMLGSPPSADLTLICSRLLNIGLTTGFLVRQPFLSMLEVIIPLGLLAGTDETGDSPSRRCLVKASMSPPPLGVCRAKTLAFNRLLTQSDATAVLLRREELDVNYLMPHDYLPL